MFLSLMTKQEMLKKEKSVTEARIQLKSRGWTENIYLPVSWLTKMLKQKNMINVLSPDGKLFNSYKSLIAHLRDNPEYQEDDIRRLVRFPGKYSPLNGQYCKYSPHCQIFRFHTKKIVQ